MKWTNKGHQFTDTETRLKEYVDRGVYIFGAGKTGKEYVKKLRDTGVVKALVDNDKNKQGITYEGIEVLTFDQYLNRNAQGFILGCVSKDNWSFVEKQLKSEGMKVDRDYIYYREFEKKKMVSLFYYYVLKKIYMPLVQVSVTERCTLKCKKCAHACNLVEKDRKDLSIDEVKRSITELFRVVDFCEEFVLIGGEPFLYGELHECINYIGEKYRDRIGLFSITTNGTLLPPDTLLKACKDRDVYIRISDYSESIPKLKQRYSRLKELLESREIRHSFYKADVWMDYGFDLVDNGTDEMKLEKVFDSCGTPCHEVRGNRYYQCVMARSISENMKKGQVGRNDYFDLSSVCSENDKRIFFEYMMGYSDKGYLDMCRNCRGIDAENYQIRVAEQM